jgi:hypothetical protein
MRVNIPRKESSSYKVTERRYSLSMKHPCFSLRRDDLTQEDTHVLHFVMLLCVRMSGVPYLASSRWSDVESEPHDIHSVSATWPLPDAMTDWFAWQSRL